MMQTPDLSISASEKRTLQKLAEGEHPSELDWVARSA